MLLKTTNHNVESLNQTRESQRKSKEAKAKQTPNLLFKRQEELSHMSENLKIKTQTTD